MADRIKEYILKMFSKDKKTGCRSDHYSYCKFPEEECTCRDIEDINHNTSLIRGGYIDSFNVMMILVFIEAEFEVDIPDAEVVVENFDTINKMVMLIKKYK